MNPRGPLCGPCFFSACTRRLKKFHGKPCNRIERPHVCVTARFLVATPDMTRGVRRPRAPSGNAG
ncbi:hypothetical protein F7234_10675 [Pseudomonas putida]|nr:hypothetical protein F7234_10675 [Pseudomonas putida]